MTPRRHRLLGSLLLALILAWEPIAQAHADDALERGIAAYGAGDYDSAREILLPLAEAGYAKAQHRIGRMYREGWGFAESANSACDWYERAANLNNSSRFNLATCFMTGSGRSLDLEKAVHLFLPLAESGETKAKAKLASAYKKMADYENYRRWMTDAADDGSKLAQVLLFTGGDEHLVPHVGWLDVGCVYFSLLLGEDYDYCDD